MLIIKGWSGEGAYQEEAPDVWETTVFLIR